MSRTRTFQTWFLGGIAAFLLIQIAERAHGQTPLSVVYSVVRVTQQIDIFQTPSQTFTLTGMPAPQGTVMVFLNGLLMLQGLDYTLAGTALTFTGQTIAADSPPVIQVVYWTAAP